MLSNISMVVCNRYSYSERVAERDWYRAKLRQPPVYRSVLPLPTQLNVEVSTSGGTDGLRSYQQFTGNSGWISSRDEMELDRGKAT